MSRTRGRAAWLVLLVMVIVIVAAAAALVGGYALTRQLRTSLSAGQGNPVVVTPSALAHAADPPPASPSSASPPAPVAALVSRTLAAAASSPLVGGRLLAYIADGLSGAPLYDHLGSTATAPASTAKLLTATALLAVRPPTSRLSTTVVLGPQGSVVLVGGGDPTLTGALGTQSGAYPDAARISELAAQLKRMHVTPTRILVDDSLFSGPAVSPAWAPEDVPTDYAAPITAVMTDGARAQPGDAVRSPSPDLAAGRELAAALGVPATPVTAGLAPAGATLLASVQSAPLSELIEQMLQASDNVIAESLARQVAIARGLPASFAGAAAAIRAVLAEHGADPGAGMLDGSGLAGGDRLSAAALVGVLRLIVGPQVPALHGLVTALPVAGWSGTLAGRYVGSSVAAGEVRAKTGTLTSVSTLAGIVYDQDGRALVFALLADRVPAGAAATASAESGLDGVVTALATCGCH